MKNIDKLKIFSATWNPEQRRIIVQFDKIAEAREFMDWLDKESK